MTATLDMAPVIRHRVVHIDRPVPIHWRRLIDELHAAGISNRMAAAAISVPHTTLQKWKEGSVPNHPDGESLIALHERYCK